MCYCFLPLYSPDYQPIEEMFHQLKQWVHRHHHEGWAAMDCVWGPNHPLEFLFQGFDSIMADDIQGFFCDTGYSIWSGTCIWWSIYYMPIYYAVCWRLHACASDLTCWLTCWPSATNSLAVPSGIAQVSCNSSAEHLTISSGPKISWFRSVSLWEIKSRLCLSFVETLRRKLWREGHGSSM